MRTKRRGHDKKFPDNVRVSARDSSSRKLTTKRWDFVRGGPRFDGVYAYVYAWAGGCI